MIEPATLVDVLRARAGAQGDALALRYLLAGDADGAYEEWTYSVLERRARAIGARLQAEVAPGDRVLLVFAPGLDFVAAFFGCLFAGAIAVPTPAPDPGRIDRMVARLRLIATDSGSRVVLSTSGLIDLAGAMGDLAPEVAGLRWIAADAVDLSLAGGWRSPGAAPDATAFLQYTSGSTGTPKGVIVTHANILWNEALISATCGQDARSHVVSWLPVFHDMGLIGAVLNPIVNGGSATLLSPVDFLRRPLSWLRAVSRFRGTTSAAPNFGYELCARRARPEDVAGLDLRSLRRAIVASEPIRPEALERFCEVFGPAGFTRESFYPCYGLAEATLFVSGIVPETPPLVRRLSAAALERGRIEDAAPGEPARGLVSCGHAPPDYDVAIVDPETLRRSPAGAIGEIWLRGRSVAGGYWRQTAATEATFRAVIAGTGEGPWLRTGDLGFLEDGELYIAGRLKDLLILRGANHYPQDLEHTAERSHPAIRPGCAAAFGIEVGGEERAAVAVEVDPRGGPVDPEEVERAVRSALLDGHGVNAHAVVLLEPRALPKTSSGKIQRRACREGFLDGTLARYAACVEAGRPPGA